LNKNTARFVYGNKVIVLVKGFYAFGSHASFIVGVCSGKPLPISTAQIRSESHYFLHQKYMT
jgi:hypothetical protein